jgi:hypothetical protein
MFESGHCSFHLGFHIILTRARDHRQTRRLTTGAECYQIEFELFPEEESKIKRLRQEGKKGEYVGSSAPLPFPLPPLSLPPLPPPFAKERQAKKAKKRSNKRETND